MAENELQKALKTLSNLPVTPERIERVTHEQWLIVAAAWCNVDPEDFARECEKNDTRMPEGSRQAWQRVFDAVRKFSKGMNDG